MIGGRRGGGGGAFGMGSMLLLLLGVAWFISSPVAGIKCYECDDTHKKRERACDTSYKEKVRECGPGIDGCLTLTIDERNGTIFVRRYCAEEKHIKSEKFCGNGEPKTPDLDTGVLFCHCKGELCNGDLGSGNSNGTIKKYPSSVMIFVAVAVTAIISGSGTKFGILRGRI